jgi:hypothetical protein
MRHRATILNANGPSSIKDSYLIALKDAQVGVMARGRAAQHLAGKYVGTVGHTYTAVRKGGRPVTGPPASLCDEAEPLRRSLPVRRTFARWRSMTKLSLTGRETSMPICTLVG